MKSAELDEAIELTWALRGKLIKVAKSLELIQKRLEEDGIKNQNSVKGQAAIP